MLVSFGHSQSQGLSVERAEDQRYETMQCFAVTQPQAIMEEGEGKVFFFLISLSFIVNLYSFCVNLKVF